MMDLRGHLLHTATLLSLVLSCSEVTSALEVGRPFRHYINDIWQTDDGLPQSTVYKVLQTHDGYLWLGTAEGLVRFDGVRFTTIDRSNTGGVLIVSALYEDPEGSLWIGTYGGGLTQYKDGKFHTFTTNDGLPNNFVWSISQDRKGTLWVGTMSGLSAWKDGKFSVYTKENGLAHETVRVTFEDRSGRLWIGTDGGLSRFEDGRMKIETFNATINAIRVSSIVEDRQGTLWYGTEAGLAAFRDGSVRLFSEKDGLTSKVARCLYLDREGTLWVGTRGGGLNRWENGTFSGFTTKDGLTSDIIWSLFEDREQSLWIGTEGGGLNRLRNPRLITYTTKDGLTHDMISSIYEDRHGRLWVGTYSGGLNYMEHGKFVPYQYQFSDLVVSIYLDKDDNLWVGTNGGGLHRCKKETQITYTTKEGLLNNMVTAIYEDPEGRLWIGTRGGLNRLEAGKVVEMMTTKQGLSHNDIISVYKDRNKNLWVGTWSGLNRIQDGKITIYNTKNGLSHDGVTYIYEDPDGTLWIGTYGGGLSRFKNGKFTAYTKKNGLYDDTVYQILDDGQGNFWMSCNKGIFRVRVKDLNDFADGKIRSFSCMSYGKQDGMQNVEGNGGSQNAGGKSRDGRLWFPTMGGLVMADPKKFNTNKIPPPIYIEEILVDNQPLLLNHGGNLVEIPPGKERFEFHFTGLSFVIPHRMTFKYLLEGFDSDWVDAGSRRVAYYTRIPPGSYKFQVMGSNNDGVWNKTAATIHFYVKPYFYQQYWFYALCVFGVIAFGMGIHGVRVKHLKSRQKELSQLVAERTQQLEGTNKQLQEANEILQRLSLLDGLTGVANRRHFDQVLDWELRRAYRIEQTLSLILIDIDFFKAFNDTYGHQAGDECLRRVTYCIRDTLNRAGDMVARYGGEEFAVILPGCSAQGAAALAQMICLRVVALGIPNESSPTGGVLTISLGVSTTPAGELTSPVKVIAAADKALYHAKSEGRNCVRSASISTAA